jgi:hypothetical protein
MIEPWAAEDPRQRGHRPSVENAGMAIGASDVAMSLAYRGDRTRSCSPRRPQSCRDASGAKARSARRSESRTRRSCSRLATAAGRVAGYRRLR